MSQRSTSTKVSTLPRKTQKRKSSHTSPHLKAKLHILVFAATGPRTNGNLLYQQTCIRTAIGNGLSLLSEGKGVSADPATTVCFNFFYCVVINSVHNKQMSITCSLFNYCIPKNTSCAKQEKPKHTKHMHAKKVIILAKCLRNTDTTVLDSVTCSSY